MRLVSLLIIILLLVATAEAKSTISFSGEGIGSMVRNIDLDWQSGDDLQRVNGLDQYTDGASGHVLLTAPGSFQYQTSDTVDASVNNRYTQSSYTKFEQGGVFSDSASITDNTPNVTPIECTAGSIGTGSVASGYPTHQTASSEYTGILQTAEITSATFISDANLSHGQQVAFDGAGLYTGDTQYHVEAGGDANTTTLNYETEATDHFFVSTNQTGGGRFRPELSYTSFEGSFVTNNTISLSDVTNTTDESGNQTPDEEA